MTEAGTRAFEGFPETGLIFYEGLEADNSKSYWTDHRQEYEDSVRAPMLALLAELEPEYGGGKLFRPYRDLRFARDKTPYKTQAGASVGDHYLQLSADGLLAASGMYRMSRDQIERYRRAVADERHGPKLARIVATLRKSGHEIAGDVMRTGPRGFDSKHPRIDLLRHRGLYAYRSWQPEQWLHTREVVDRVRAAWRDFGPLSLWLAANVGPADVD